MRSLIRVAVCLAALLPVRFALADDEGDNGIKVDVVVDMTDAGRKIPRPTPDHPAFYLPVTRGYTLGMGFVANEKAPPPTAEVQRMIQKALAEQGYLLMTKTSRPSLILMLWWGYKAPVTLGPGGGGDIQNSITTAGSGPSTGSIMQEMQTGQLPTGQIVNNKEMEELVMGSDYEAAFGTYRLNPSIRLERILEEKKVPQYYLMVSALDFKDATQHKVTLLWTARVSTRLWSHTLDQVLPTLITVGAPMFGRDTDGPQLNTQPLVPIGHVIVGTPVLKSDAPASAAPKASP
jgi:hypothetical protein